MMTFASDMIYKKRMHQIIQLVFFLALSRSENVTPNKDTSQNAVKRFNLQDLLGQQNIQLNGGNDKQDAHLASKTQTIDVAELLAAAQKAASNQPQAPQEDVKPKQEDIMSKFVEPKKAVDIDITADKNGNFNLENIPGLTAGSNTHSSPMSMNDLQSLLKGKETSDVVPSATIDSNNVVREEINLGKQKLEIEAAGKRATRYTLAKGPDGGLNLIPIVGDESGGRNNYEFLQPKEYEEKGRSRQQMQMTTLSQALYSPFPSDANILHLHLKGKDGKDGKAGNKGPMGPLGPKGPDGPKGPKGDAGTCSSQINGLFECTPDELDSLSNRVDYLEKICKKVENAAKKHNLVHSMHNKSTSASTAKSDVSTKVEHSKKEESTEKEGFLTKEKASTDEKEHPIIKEKESAKEKEPTKEKEEIKDKDIKEEATARLKEKEALKLEKDIEENGVTRAKKEETEAKIKEDKEKEKEEKPKEKAKEETEEKKEKVAPTEVEKAKEKEDSKEINEEVPSDDEKTEKKDKEPIKKNKDGSPPTERSMIDIKAKLKIAELDLMDRVNQARAGAAKSS